MPKGSSPILAGSNPIPLIYQEMLADAVSASPSRFNEEGKAIKRRRVGGRVVSRYEGETSGQETEHSTVPADDTDTDNAILEETGIKQQTAYNDSDGSTDSDMDWEEVDLVKDRAEQNVEEGEEPMDLVIGGEDLGAAKRHIPRRKADSAADKKVRLEIHKTHLLCLLAHVHLRNHWCDDVEVQVGCLTLVVSISTLTFLKATLKKFLSKRTISYLNPGSELSQFQRSRSLMDGLAQASEAWRTKFKITARGLRRPYWVEHVEALKDVRAKNDTCVVPSWHGSSRSDFKPGHSPVYPTTWIQHWRSLISVLWLSNFKGRGMLGLNCSALF